MLSQSQKSHPCKKKSMPTFDELLQDEELLAEFEKYWYALLPMTNNNTRPKFDFGVIYVYLSFAHSPSLVLTHIHSESHFCKENLDFWREVEAFKCVNCSGASIDLSSYRIADAPRREEASKIINLYLLEDSKQQIGSIPESAVNRVRSVYTFMALIHTQVVELITKQDGEIPTDSFEAMQRKARETIEFNTMHEWWVAKHGIAHHLPHDVL